MPIRSYPFLKFKPDDPPRPILPIRLINPANGSAMRGLGLVDTGADECVIPAPYSFNLGHKLDAVTAKVIGTASGTTVAYGHTTRIEIFDAKNPLKVVYTIPDTPIDFVMGCNTILLGVKNFLGRFILTIDYKRQVFSIQNPSR